MEDFLRETWDMIWRDLPPEQRRAFLDRLPLEEPLSGLKAGERLRGLEPEQRLRGLSAEELRRLKDHLNKLN